MQHAYCFFLKGICMVQIISPIPCFLSTFDVFPNRCFSNTFATSKKFATHLLKYCFSLFCNIFATFPQQMLQQCICHFKGLCNACVAHLHKNHFSYLCFCDAFAASSPTYVSNMFAASKDYVKHLMLIFQKAIYPIFCFCNTFAACFSDTFATSKDYAMHVPVILKIIFLIFCFCNPFAASSPTYVLATRLPLQKIMQHVCHSS